MKLTNLSTIPLKKKEKITVIMIHFCTERTHDVSYPHVTKEDIIDYCKDKPMLGLDCEFNNLDPYYATLLLVVVGDKENQFVIDATSVDISFLQPLEDTTFVGHNIKIDYKMCKVNGFTFNTVYDTMIAEQRLGLGSGRKNGLDAVLERRLGIPITKDTRKEFIQMDHRSIFEDKHINYAAGDIEHLESLVDIHRPLIDKLSMRFLLYDIEFPLIPIMGDCDLEGFVLDIPAWKEVINENKKKRNRLLSEMDEEVERLVREHRPDLIGGQYTRKRVQATYTQGDLFGEDKVVEHESKGVTKYTSAKQMKQLFHDLKEKPPMNRDDKETVAVPMLQAYLANNPDSRLAKFLNIYMEHSAVNKELSTYGEKFLKMINRVTGKIHTVFRHCSTDTGRFSSGDSKAGFPNLQNIPAHKKFRHCFGVEEGYEVTTCDLSGAELIVMVALSGDLRLMELASGDMHSHMANICMEKIYAHRGLEWTDDLVVSKEQNKDKRTGFKPMTFGTIYGMKKKKAAEQLSVTDDEGQIVVDTIRDEIPDVFAMVEQASKTAMNRGYVVHNTRTNSRRWFTPVLTAKKQLKEMKEDMPLEPVAGLPFYLEYRNAQPKHLMKFKDATTCESAARNTRIQGTQADMVKEAIVEIDREIKERRLDLVLLGTVHDELIYKHPVGYKVGEESAGEWISRMMREVANRYLDGVVEMGADYETMSTWTK